MEENIIYYSSNTTRISNNTLSIIKEILYPTLPNEIIYSISKYLPKKLYYKSYNIKVKQNRKDKYFIHHKVTSRYK